MDKIELLKISIRKALENNDTDFLEGLIDLLPLDIINSIEDEDILLGLYEYSQANYEKAKYLASIAYLKGVKQAKIILDLIETNALFQQQPSDNSILSYIIKKSDDILIITLTILRYYRYLIQREVIAPEAKILRIINTAIQIYPKLHNFYILKAYIITEIFQQELDPDFMEYIERRLPKEVKEIISRITST
ncbi:MAG: hypothetical protein RMJ51_06825 [Candidatus Calescibacterium sp.]|nr:hypothetical protein [Candidatus Calescibacterium sp.]MCX7972351.1 hypothetical protein [bacterium]MDW8195928.1 hypothetical protein [Candidatus Calescibacterium sp.]